MTRSTQKTEDFLFVMSLNTVVTKTETGKEKFRDIKLQNGAKRRVHGACVLYKVQFKGFINNNISCFHTRIL